MPPVNDACYKQWTVIEFLAAEKETAVNTHKCLCAVYENYAVNRSIVGHWAKGCKISGSEETDLCNMPCSGCSATATNPDILKYADGIIHQDRHSPLKTGPMAFSQHWKCKYNFHGSWIFKGVHKMNSMLYHSRTQAWKENNFFWLAEALWCWGEGGILSRTVTGD